MANAREYVWIIPIISAIFGILTLITPTASMSTIFYPFSGNLWLWGLYVTNTYGGFLTAETAYFITDILVLIPSLIATALIALSSILILVSSIQLKKNRDFSSLKTKAIITGLLFMLAEVLWLIMISLFFPVARFMGPPIPGMTYNFWTVNYSFVSIPLHSPGFGVIGGFIAGGISLVAAGVASHYSKERPVKPVTLKEPVAPVTTEAPQEVEETTATGTIFCPECGAKIEDPDAKFCGSCGHEYR